MLERFKKWFEDGVRKDTLARMYVMDQARKGNFLPAQYLHIFEAADWLFDFTLYLFFLVGVTGAVVFSLWLNDYIAMCYSVSIVIILEALMDAYFLREWAERRLKELLKARRRSR